MHLHRITKNESGPDHVVSEGEAADLKLESGSAVLIVRHVVYDMKDHPVEVDEATYLPGRWVFEKRDPIGWNVASLFVNRLRVPWMPGRGWTCVGSSSECAGFLGRSVTSASEGLAETRRKVESLTGG